MSEHIAVAVEMVSSERHELVVSASLLSRRLKKLEEANGPVRARDIHAAVSELHGVPVRRASVRQALSAHTTGADRRFRRTGHGLYELVAD